MSARDVVGHAHVGDDEGIYTQPRAGARGLPPQIVLARRRVGVQHRQNLGAARVRTSHRLAKFVGSEVQARIVARIGRVLDPAIDGIGVRVDGGA